MLCHSYIKKKLYRVNENWQEKQSKERATYVRRSINTSRQFIFFGNKPQFIYENETKNFMAGSGKVRVQLRHNHYRHRVLRWPWTVLQNNIHIGTIFDVGEGVVNWPPNLQHNCFTNWLWCAWLQTCVRKTRNRRHMQEPLNCTDYHQ